MNDLNTPYKLISLILPVYNQASHIGEVVEQFQNALKSLNHPFEIILVPNGDRDHSKEVCAKLAQESHGVAVRAEPSPQAGWGAAVKHGLTQARGDLLCYTNSARTTSEEIQLTLRYALANPGAIIKANRKIRESLFRRAGSLLYNLECRMLFDLTFWDINGTPKVFPRRCEKLMALESGNDLIDLEFNVIARENNYQVLELPIFSYKRHGGQSTTRLRSAFRLYWGALQMKIRRRRTHD